MNKCSLIARTSGKMKHSFASNCAANESDSGTWSKSADDDDDDEDDVQTVDSCATVPAEPWLEIMQVFRTCKRPGL